jgi:hypothetical protein
MTAPEGRRTSGLTPEAADLVEKYFARVHGALLVAAVGECEEALEDLRDHVVEELAASGGTPDQAERLLDELGSPESLAAEYADVTTDSDSARPRLSEVDNVKLHGRVLGMPYELRVPNSERIASRMWNPLDPRIFVPRVFGLGWDINFGALAVKLHLVNPDDEDEPFAAVSPRLVTATLALPLLLAVAFVVLAAASWPGLPARLPVHWNVVGEADNFWGRGAAIAFLAAMALLPVAFAVSTHLRRRPALNRVAATAFATFLSVIAVSQLVQTLRYVGGDRGVAPTFVGLVLALVLPFALFVFLSRAGRSAEQRRDLEKTTKKGSVR